MSSFAIVIQPSIVDMIHENLRETSFIASQARSTVPLKITSGAASACPIFFLHSLIHTIAACFSGNL
jgi:hypothetical protein